MAVNAVFTDSFDYTAEGGDTHDETDVAIGSAAADRLVFVLILTFLNDPDADINSMTIGGVSATRYSRHVESDFFGIEAWYAPVPTGTTATISLAHDSSDIFGGGTFAVYSVYGADVSDPIFEIDNLFLANAVTNALTASVNVPVDGAAIGFNGGLFVFGGTTTTAWTYLTETVDFQVDQEGVFFAFASAALNVPAGVSSQSVTATMSSTGSVIVNDRVLHVVSINPGEEETNFPVTADEGSFELTGQPVLFRHAFIATHGSYSLTGQAASFQHSFSAGMGSFSAVGQDIVFDQSFVAGTGSFELTGQVANFAVVMPADVGNYGVAGQDVEFLNALRFTAEHEAFAFAGQDVDFLEGASVLGDVGSFNYTGQDVTFVRALRMAADHGSFSFVGQTTTFNFSLPASEGSFLFAGQDVTFTQDNILDAGVGDYTLAGSLLFSVSRRLDAAHGLFAYSGQTANLLASYSFAADPGSFEMAGQTASLTKQHTLTADAGAYAVSGQAVALIVAHSLQAGTGSFALNGQVADFNVDLENPILVAGEGMFTLSGQAVNVRRALRLSAETGSFASAGQDTTPKRMLRVVADVGTYALTGQQVAALRALRMLADAGAYTLTSTVQLPVNRRVVSNVGGFSLNGQVLTFSKSSRLAALTGAYTITAPPVDLNHIRQLVFEADEGVYTADISGLSFYSTSDGPGMSLGRPLGDTTTEVVLLGDELGDTETETVLLGRPL